MITAACHNATLDICACLAGHALCRNLSWAFMLAWSRLCTLHCVQRLSSAHAIAGGWFSIMMALIFGGIMLLWFWGSSHKNVFFAKHFNTHIKKLEDLLAVVDNQDLSAPPKFRLVAENKPVRCIFLTHCSCLSEVEALTCILLSDRMHCVGASFKQHSSCMASSNLDHHHYTLTMDSCSCCHV